MEILQGERVIQIAGAKVGETILVTLITGKIEGLILNDVNRNGIEGFNITLKSQPLTFYPYTNILKVTKHIEYEGL